MADEQPIDSQYIESLRELAEPIQEFKHFIADISSKRQEVDAAFKDYNAKKNKLDGLIDTINQMVETCSTAKASVDPQVVHIQSMVTQSDEAKGRIDAVERHIGEQKGKIDSDSQTIETTKNRFDGLKADAEKLAAELASHQTSLQSQIAKIQGKANTLEELEKNLTNLQTQAETAKVGAESANQAIKGQQQAFQESIDQTTAKLNELNQQQSDLQGKITEITETHSEIIDAYNELLADEMNDQGQVTKPCVSTKINDLLSKIQAEHDALLASHKRQTESFDKLYEELSNKINSLLPGAGAAGLASSYYEAKMRYTTTNDLSSLDDDSGKKLKLPWYMFIPQSLAYVFNLALFLAPLMTLVMIFPDFKVPDAFATQPYAILLYKLTLTIPLVAISSYGIVSLVTNRRLYEEYNHKQRVMQLYHSFKAEIDQSSDNDLKIKLLNVMLDVVRDKPASKLSRHEKTIFNSLQDQIQKIGDSVLGK